MKKSIVFSLSVIIALFLSLATLNGCDRDDYGYPPVYGSVYAINENPHVGDTITIKAQVLKQGNGIYKAEYKWKINGSGYTKTVIDPLKSDPAFTYVITTTGKHTLSMSAKLHMSKSTKTGQINIEASAQAGNFTVYE